MKDYFANPVVPDEDKCELLAKLSKDTGFSENTQNFLGLLVQARRFDVVDEIVTAFENEYCKITDTQVRVGGPVLLGLIRNAGRAHTSASPCAKPQPVTTRSILPMCICPAAFGGSAGHKVHAACAWLCPPAGTKLAVGEIWNVTTR